MIIKRGKITNLTGNVIVYWNIVQNDNKKKNQYKVLAINFIVSPIPIGDKILATSFPPMPFKNFDEILEKIENVNCDIIYGGKIQFPKDNKNLEEFHKNQFDHYNKIIEFYISLYKEKFSFSIGKLTEKEKLFLIEDLIKKIRDNKKTNKSKKMLLTMQVHQVVSSLKKTHKYDFSFFLSILFEKGKKIDELLNLYAKKYIAIFYEHYEEAEKLKIEIDKIKAKI